MKPTLYEIYQENPQAALDHVLDEGEKTLWKGISMWQSSFGIDNKTRYGRYRKFTREDFVDRTYNIEYWDGMVSIFWTDVLFDSKQGKHIPKSMI